MFILESKTSPPLIPLIIPPGPLLSTAFFTFPSPPLPFIWRVFKTHKTQLNMMLWGFCSRFSLICDICGSTHNNAEKISFIILRYIMYHGNLREDVKIATKILLFKIVQKIHKKWFIISYTVFKLFCLPWNHLLL